jgi:DnaJ homologue, subfamily C, member 28, conserved domain
MTERKPRGMDFTSWIDQQILDAQKRGVFDNLPGAGKPLEFNRDPDADYGQAWMRDYARREGVPPEEFLPTPLRLRKEIERLAETVEQMRSEPEVREVVGDLNRRIIEWRRIPVGPPIFVRLVDKEEMVGRWRAAQATRQARPPEQSAAPRSEADTRTRRARTGRWRRLGSGGGKRG